MADSMICPTCNGKGQIDSREHGLGIIMAARRKELGLTQQELADRCGMHRATIANIETGRHVIRLKQVRPLAAALEIEPEALLP